MKKKKKIKENEARSGKMRIRIKSAQQLIIIIFVVKKNRMKHGEERS